MTLPKYKPFKISPHLLIKANYSHFLCFLSNLQSFIPRLPHQSNLLHKQLNEWDWNLSTDAALQSLTLHRTTLAYYDRTKQGIIDTVVSKYGLGSALFQGGYPFAFTSQTLTNVETWNVHIEFECLSVCFGLEKFHVCMYGRHLTVQNDHKPLEMIQNKSTCCTLHVQSMLFWLQRYDFTIQYKPSKEMVLGDWLAGTPQRREYLHQHIQYIPSLNMRLNIIRGTIEPSPIYSTPYHMTLNGLPEIPHQVLQSPFTFGVQETRYWWKKAYSSWETECARAPELYDRTLTDLHNSHQGNVKMQLIVRATVYWPRIDADIFDYVQSGKVCIQNVASQLIQPRLPWDIPWDISFCLQRLPRPSNPYNSNPSTRSHNKDTQISFPWQLTTILIRKLCKMYGKPAYKNTPFNTMYTPNPLASCQDH